jgi:hypothetical protein
MKRRRRLPRPILTLAALAAAAAGLSAGSGLSAREDEGRVSFNRDVRPILSEHCFLCHGPDPGGRKAGLRLDQRAGATTALKSGAVAVVPGDPEASELCLRVASDDDTERMPPADSGARLTPAQVETLRRWVAQGAVWEEHWSLIPPQRPPVPEVRGRAWARNEVDRFLLAKMEARGVAPSPEADRVTLVRRLANDLTGLPPTPEEVDAFLADGRPDAYERLVDRLLASPHYGERMAIAWLDLVRYADTVGYHSDVERSVSLYRDYVINAFNEDRPFDRFTVEQLAGDLLPEPTVWQKVASAYNMLGMTTEEGGAQAREYLAKYAADRVRNVGSVWMGATLGCAECHDHKYDPYPTRDFYALAAFFADLNQPGVGTPKPTLPVPTPEQEAALSRLRARIEALKQKPKGASPADPDDEPARAKELASLQAEEARLKRSVRATVVSVAGPPRVTRVLRRGDWMDDSGAVVEPAVPRSLGPLDLPEGRASRLDLARWLVAPEHPRTARVVVNRLWKAYFGAGLADSLDDLGAQGEWPTHPELLDWLAVEFREHGWSVKHVVRLLVTSSAYRQSSRPRDDLATADPANRLVARQASFRREAELIRDNALAVSGLLVRTISGESVRPYQPAGYWRFLNFPKREYVPSAGPGQYRRGLYTHWQRTLLHPALLAFDAPSREMCTARRPVSNTPQAALALLNDPSQVEAARVLAGRALREGGADDDGRLSWLWRRVLSRPPAPEEAAVLAALLAKHRREFAADPDAARRLVAVGRAPADPDVDPDALAAWTSVARAVLNLDETITRD